MLLDQSSGPVILYVASGCALVLDDGDWYNIQNANVRISCAVGRADPTLLTEWRGTRHVSRPSLLH